MEDAYVWEEVYEAAILETDDEQLQKRIRAAKAAIDDRLHELQLTTEVRLLKRGNVSAMRLLG